MCVLYIWVCIYVLQAYPYFTLNAALDAALAPNVLNWKNESIRWQNRKNFTSQLQWEVCGKDLTEKNHILHSTFWGKHIFVHDQKKDPDRFSFYCINVPKQITMTHQYFRFLSIFCTSTMPVVICRTPFTLIYPFRNNSTHVSNISITSCITEHIVFLNSFLMHPAVWAIVAPCRYASFKADGKYRRGNCTLLYMRMVLSFTFCYTVF